MNRKTALIIISPLPSHALPSFYLANLLHSNGYEVFYFVHHRKNLQKIVEANGFSYIQSNTSNIGYSSEIRYVTNNYREKSYTWKILKFIEIAFTNKLFNDRKNEIDEVLQKINPSIVLIDVFTITNYLFFYPHRQSLKILFFSPMLSTHTQKGYPILSDSEWIKDKQYEKRREKEHPLKNNFSAFNLFLDRMILKRVCRKIDLKPENSMEFDTNYFTQYHFKNVPELVLAPLELELSAAIQQPNQHYLGLCITPNNRIPDVDAGFNIEDVIKMKSSGNKVILCSFGTYFTTYEQHKIITRFITNVIESVIDLDNVQLIVASNEVVLEVIKKTVPVFSNVHLFSKVPQKEVLALADVFITHGGLGSLKEGIAYGVPMLVYPLDKIWDNNGNAFKIAYHQLGLRGLMEKDDAEDLKAKISEILNNPNYRNNINALRNKIQKKYSTEFVSNTFMGLCKP